MALSDERIEELKEQAVSAWRAAGFEPMLQVFVARAIEAEVQKQDTALIRQLVEALENHAGNYKLTKTEAAVVNVVTDAARARLEGKP